MEPLCLWRSLLVGLLTLSVKLSFAVPPKPFTQPHVFLPKPQEVRPSMHEELKAPAEERERVKTVTVTCHPDSVEITIKADMFGIGAPVHGDELRLGVEEDDYCRAPASSGDEYRIMVGLEDCGTKHWMNEDTLVYTNLLIYSPRASLDGLIRMDEAVIPIECHYERKYSVSSDSLAPTWIPFMSTQAAVETLAFNLRIMTNDWFYQRGANVFHLGDPIAVEASIHVGHHMGLRIFLSTCVATLYPDIHSTPRYVFIENGCLVDSQLQDSKSQFLPRIQDEKLHLVIDAFRFHNEESGQLYITCHLNAVPANDPQAPYKACTLVNGRWRSADGNDYLCANCQSQTAASHSKPHAPAKPGPRGFESPAESDSQWSNGLTTNSVWEQVASVGPLMVLPTMKSGPLPAEDLPPVLNNLIKPSVYGSQWRSGINRVDLEKGLLPEQPTEEEEEEEQQEEEDQSPEDDQSGPELKYGEAGSHAVAGETPVITWKEQPAALDRNGTADISDVSRSRPTLNVKAASNETDLSDSHGPK